MDTTALIIWQSFLHTSPADRRMRLLDCISPELISELENLAAPQQDPFEHVEPIEDELLKVHYSWLTPFLRSLTENEIKLFLSALTLEQINGLKTSLLLSNTIPLPSDIGKTYMKGVLFETIAPSDLLPIALLPQDPLNELLDLSRQELDSLINLLSMHDLSIEVRHVIETSKLKEIYGLLSKAQETFLKTLLHKKEPVSFKKMGLLGWNGDLERTQIDAASKRHQPHRQVSLWQIQQPLMVCCPSA